MNTVTNLATTVKPSITTSRAQKRISCITDKTPPPLIDLQKVNDSKIPIGIFMGGDDQIVTPIDATWAME